MLHLHMVLDGYEYKYFCILCTHYEKQPIVFLTKNRLPDKSIKVVNSFLYCHVTSSTRRASVIKNV